MCWVNKKYLEIRERFFPHLQKEQVNEMENFNTHNNENKTITIQVRERRESGKRRRERQ